MKIIQPKTKKYAVIFVVGFIIIIQGLSLTMVLMYYNIIIGLISWEEEIKWAGFDGEYLYKISIKSFM